MAEGSKKYEWTEIASMSAPRVFTSVAWHDDHLYVVGGCDRIGEPVDSVEKYDPKTNAWTKCPSMPTKRAAPIVAVFDGKLVAIGGVGVTQAPVDAVEIMDAASGEWQRLTPLSEPLMGMAHVVRERRIDLFGGMGADTNPRDHYKSFVLETDGTERWQALAPMPTARYAAKAFLRGGKIYVLGGRQGKLPVATFEVYDIASRSWTVYPSIPSKRVFCNYVMTDTKIITLGGLKQSAQQGFSDACELYTFGEGARGHWAANRKHNMPAKRGDFTALVADDRVVVVGGIGNAGEPLASTDVLDPGTKKWTRHGETRVARCTSASTMRDHVIYLVGGVTGDGATETCEKCRVPSAETPTAATK